MSSVSASTVLMASMIRESSPPDATSPRGFSWLSGVVEIRN